MKNFQVKVVESIISGDLLAFKRCCIGKNHINIHLLPYKELEPLPKYNRYERYIRIKGPTILMFAILCEQDEIVEYLLEIKNPDLSIKVEGYNCLHLAAMIKSPKCLQLLLQHKWIQENIDEPVGKEGDKITALHIAINYKRHVNAILLLDQFPKPRWSYSKETTFIKTTETSPSEKEDVHERPILFNSKSEVGSTLLYMAVFLRDYKMVRILLSFNADPSIPCSRGMTPIQLAEEMKKSKDEKKNENKKIDEIDEIITAFKNIEAGGNPDTLESIKLEFAPELLDNNDLPDEKEEEEEFNPISNTELLEQIKNQLEEINEKLSKI